MTKEVLCNDPPCHSEHGEESHSEKDKKEIHRFALNDKLMVNGYAGLSECKFRKCRESTQITVFVIPNTVRNLAREKEKRFIAPL